MQILDLIIIAGSREKKVFTLKNPEQEAFRMTNFPIAAKSFGSCC
jgi:hypothetical protein